MLRPAEQRTWEDTGHLAILVDDNQVGEVPGYTLWDDPLQSQTSSVVHVSIRDDGGQLVTKLQCSLQDKWKWSINMMDKKNHLWQEHATLNML